jgi:hypothetical protein
LLVGETAPTNLYQGIISMKIKTRIRAGATAPQAPHEPVIIIVD